MVETCTKNCNSDLMKKVMAFGCFSIVHPGHLMYLEEAKKLGNHLTVVLATDNNIEKEKGFKPVFNQTERQKLLTSFSIVDEAIVGYEDDFFKIIKERKPDVIALGYDAKCDPAELEEKLGIKVVKLTVFSGHKTSEIIGAMKK